MDNSAPIVVVSFGSNVVGIAVDSGQIVWSCQEPSYATRLEVAGDRVFLLTAKRLVCRRYWDGLPLWSQTLPLFGESIFVTGGKVLVGGNGEVVCYDELGNPLWHHPFKGKGLGLVAFAVPGKATQVDYRD